MDVVGIGRIESRKEGSGGGATVPAATVSRVLFTREERCCYSTSRYCSRERNGGPAARAVRGAGNAGRGASPTAGKREGFSF
jgi:hypothetical protein